MESPNDNLKQKYDLHKSSEVERAAKRTERRTGTKLPQSPDARIQNYLDRLEHLLLDPGKKQKRKMFGTESRPRALMLLREMVMARYVRPNKEKLAQGATRVEERAARELGMEVRYGVEELAQRGDIAMEDLEKSLDNWISYLSDANEPHPAWFRYYVFRNILDLCDYDKDKGEFSKRSPGSTRVFPDIDRGALAYIEQTIEAAKDPAMLARLQKAQEATGTPQDQRITKEQASSFAKLSFAKQYAEAMKIAGEITPEMRKETRGKWIKYGKGTDPTALWASLQNKGVAWCTKGFVTADTQLKGGDFYVYYTLDKQGRPTIPRIAVRMQGDAIGEVRGVADNEQNLESAMVAIADEKMKELPGAERYKKASADMKQLTKIEKKIQGGSPLTKDDLVFLYELNSTIEGFGYQRDPRIQELRSQRNPETDMPILFDCAKEQITHHVSEINETTKAYIGPLAPGIFDVMQEYNIEHMYTSFPDGRIRKETIAIGGKTKNQLTTELKQANINIDGYAQDMLKSKDFTVLPELESAILIRLKVKDLGLKKEYPITTEIYQRIEELGLELCPAEVGPQYRLQHTDQSLGDWFYIGMKQITGWYGIPLVFRLARDEDGLWLGGLWAGPAREWNPSHEFVFRLRKKNLKT